MNFTEKVMAEVVRELYVEGNIPPEDLINLIELLLLREEQEGYRSLLNKERHEKSDYADLYAAALIAYFDGVTFRERGFKLPLGNNTFYYQDKHKFIAGSFISNLSQYSIPVQFPRYLRKEHTYILGGTGSGKTQLIQQFIHMDLESNASIIVIDSQGDLIRTLKHCKLIDPERLVIVDPVDSVEHPLALNIFDIGQDQLSNLSSVDFERHINGVVELLNFVFSSVMESALTDKQSVVFNFCIRLLLTIPKATLDTFVEILEDGVGKYQQYVNKLAPVSRSFFRKAFPEQGRSEYNHTRQEILRRLYFLLENPTISRLFKSPENKLNISREMDKGKVILVSTDRSLLKREGCAFFGRYFISLVAQAMQDRLNRPPEHRRKCYLYIDECGDYLQSDDVNISDILEKGRKYNVGVTLAHQQISQLPPNVFQSIRTNTAIKMVGTCSHSDANMLKNDMDVDYIKQPKLKFLTKLKGAPSFQVDVKAGLLENLEQRTEEELEAIMEENRRKYSVSLALEGEYIPAPKCDEPSVDTSNQIEDWNAK